MLIPSWAEKKRCAWPGDLNRFICRSRCRVGWCEFSALLFSPLCFRGSTAGEAGKGSRGTADGKPA